MLKLRRFVNYLDYIFYFDTYLHFKCGDGKRTKKYLEWLKKIRFLHKYDQIKTLGKYWTCTEVRDTQKNYIIQL